MIVGMKTLSIKQPWAWLIMAGLKDIENRDWRTHFRGRFAVHAGKYRPSEEELLEIEQHQGVTIPRDKLTYGAVLGTVELVDCVTRHGSQWFQGSFGFVLRDPRRCDPIPCNGKLGFFQGPVVVL